MLNKKIIAKEWLILIGSLLFGITLLPVIFRIIGLIVNPYGVLTFQGNDYIFVLIPYFSIQFVRSVIWAIKVIKQK